MACTRPWPFPCADRGKVFRKMSFAIRVENLGKCYRLGMTHAGSIRELVNRAVARLLGRRQALLPHEVEGLVGERAGVEPDGTFWALRDVSFEVQPGEVVGLIGRNGAGKSTLLKVLSQITAPTHGRVELHGRVASLLEVGTGFHPELSGRENVFLNGAILGMTREETRRKFDEIVAFAEIEKFIDTPVKRYSSGMYVRLAFAVAAHLEPEILLVDEVLAVGDVAFQQKCLGKMNEVAHLGRTVLVVSHNMEVMRKLCTRVVALEGGRVAGTGSPTEIIPHYLKVASAEAVHDFPEPADDAPVYVSRLMIEDGQGRQNNSIPAGEPWQVRIRLMVRRPTPHLIVAVGLERDGVMLWTEWSPARDYGPGFCDVVFRNEVVALAAGSYALAVGLSSYERVISYRERVGTLHIANYSSSLNRLRLQGIGMLINPMDVSIHPCDQVATSR